MDFTWTVNVRRHATVLYCWWHRRETSMTNGVGSLLLDWKSGDIGNVYYYEWYCLMASTTSPARVYAAVVVGNLVKSVTANGCNLQLWCRLFCSLIQPNKDIARTIAYGIQCHAIVLKMRQLEMIEHQNKYHSATRSTAHYLDSHYLLRKCEPMLTMDERMTHLWF